MRKELEKRVAAEETNPNRNTDERRKVANVGRPNTAKNPMDTRSKLAKQGEIKTKIIDENEVKSMNFQKHHNLPDDLVAAVRAVMEKKNPFAKDDDKKPKKDDDSDDADDKKAKSKKDDDSDDAADDQDEKVGTSGKKTKVDLNPKMKMANESVVTEAKSFYVRSGDDRGDEKVHGKHSDLKSALAAAKKISGGHVVQTSGPKKNSSLETITHYHGPDGHVYKADDNDSFHPKYGTSYRDHMKEELEQIDEISRGMAIKAYQARQFRNDPYRDDIDADPEREQKKASATLARIHKKFGPGMAKHAERAAADDFRRHPLTKGKDDYLASKQHVYGQLAKPSTKRGMKQRKDYMSSNKGAIKVSTREEFLLSDEETARILAKLNEAGDEDDHQDGPEHIIMQLRKAKSLGANNRPIHFHDGSKVHVDPGHVQKALDKHASFKKAPEKDEFTQKLQASHASFKKAIGEG